MIHQENPTLTYADAGPISAAFSENPMLHHSCGGKWRTKGQDYAGKTAPPLPPIGKIPSDLRIKTRSCNPQSP